MFSNQNFDVHAEIVGVAEDLDDPADLCTDLGRHATGEPVQMFELRGHQRLYRPRLREI